MKRWLLVAGVLLAALSLSCDEAERQDGPAASSTTSQIEQIDAAIERMQRQAAAASNPLAVERLAVLQNVLATSGLAALEGKLHPVSVFVNIYTMDGPPEVLVFTYLAFDDLAPDRIVLREEGGTAMSLAIPTDQHGVQDEGVFGFGVIRMVVPGLADAVADNKVVHATLHVGDAAVSDTIEVDMSRVGRDVQ